MVDSSRRVYERFVCALPVVMTDGTTEVEGLTRDLSLGGMFIAGDFPFPFGAQVTLKLRLPAMREPSEIPAVVRWKTPQGIGIQFGSLRAKEVWALNQLFKTAEEAPQ